MPFITNKCDQCGKIAESIAEYQIEGARWLVLKCGHLISEETIAQGEIPENIVSLDGKHLMPFQCEGVRFLEESNGRALIADEMGLGKTVQSLGFLAIHRDLRPFTVVVKSSLKAQWQYEIMRWMGEDTFSQIIDDSRTHILKGMPAYIISFDLLRRFNGTLSERFLQAGVKTIIIDECQQIKNPESERTAQVRNLCRPFKHIIALSGTPIKNNASEYFPILNILQPNLYPRYSTFVYNDCDSYYNGFTYKVGGLRDPERFKERTKHFIIRRERKDVLPDLPAITRNFHFDELATEVEKSYRDTLKAFQLEYSEHGMGGFAESGNILAYLSKMRHITGISKVNPCVDHVTEFLESTERKIVIFVHHKDVGELLKQKLSKVCNELGINDPLMLTSELNSEARAGVVEAFREDEKNRVVIASTLAAGEGLNLQFCNECVVLERQWNPANEEQAEGRFIRIGQKEDKVTATYFVAVGTVDEFFSELVEQKREYVTQTLGGDAVQWDQSSLVKELAEILNAKGGQKWGW